MRRLPSRLATVAAALLVAACRGEPIRHELSKVYGETYVEYESEDSTHLLVAFPNSPFAERPDTTRAATARKVAEYVRDHFPRYKKLDKVTVEFLTRKETERLWRNIAARYTFTHAELGEPRP